MEAEVEPSIETEERLRKEAAEAVKRKAELERMAQEAIRKQQMAELEARELAENRKQIRRVCNPADIHFGINK